MRQQVRKSEIPDAQTIFIDKDTNLPKQILDAFSRQALPFLYVNTSALQNELRLLGVDYPEQFEDHVFFELPYTDVSQQLMVAKTEYDGVFRVCTVRHSKGYYGNSFKSMNEIRASGVRVDGVYHFDVR